MPNDKALESVYQRVMDRWLAVGDASKLSVDEQDFIAIATLLNENANGSLSQYFENSYSDYVARAVGALVRIGCAEAAKVVEEACRLFPGGPSAEQDKRVAHMDAFNEGEYLRLHELSEALEAVESRVWRALAVHAQTRAL